MRDAILQSHLIRPQHELRGKKTEDERNVREEGRAHLIEIRVDDGHSQFFQFTDQLQKHLLHQLMDQAMLVTSQDEDAGDGDKGRERKRDVRGLDREVWSEGKRAIDKTFARRALQQSDVVDSITSESERERVTGCVCVCVSESG